MRSITVFYDQSHYIYRWLKPLFVSKKEFAKLGYRIGYSAMTDYLPIFADACVSVWSVGRCGEPVKVLTI